MNIEKKIAT